MIKEEDVQQLRLRVYFDKFNTEDLELMEDAFAEKYFNNYEMIRSKHLAAREFEEQNKTLLTWFKLIKELRLERNGFNTD